MTYLRRRPPRPWAPVLGLLTACAMAAPAWATSVLPMSLDDLTDTSDFVVEATVLAAETEQTPDMAQMPVWTWTRIRVEKYVKGTGPAELMVKQPGGVFGKKVVTVEGLAPLRVGDRFVLFLHAAEGREGAVTPVGYGAGAYRVFPGLGGVLWASRDPGVSFASVKPGTTSISGGVAPNGVALAPRALPRNLLLAKIAARVGRK